MPNLLIINLIDYVMYTLHIILYHEYFYFYLYNNIFCI